MWGWAAKAMFGGALRAHRLWGVVDISAAGAPSAVRSFMTYGFPVLDESAKSWLDEDEATDKSKSPK